MSDLKDQINASMKEAMRAKDKQRLSVLRMILADIKRVEVDERTELSDERALAILDKMTKQRRDSAAQYRDAGRDELAQKEEFEIGVISDFLPAALTDDELSQLIDQAIADSGASGPRDMGKVMGQLKPKVQGRADMGEVSKRVKERLS